MTGRKTFYELIRVEALYNSFSYMKEGDSFNFLKLMMMKTNLSKKLIAKDIYADLKNKSWPENLRYV